MKRTALEVAVLGGGINSSPTLEGAIARSHLGARGKASWIAVVIIVALLGVMIYLIARGDGMSRRQIAAAQARQADFDAYVRNVPASSGPADELSRLSELRTSGVITAEEFERQKARILA